MNQKSFNRDLTEGNIAVQLICFIGPLFLSNILQTAYNVVDMAVVGRCTGNTGLSAVSICGDLVHILTFIAFGFANAGQVLISHHTGARNWDSVKTLIGNLLHCFSLFRQLSVCCRWFSGILFCFLPILRLQR